MPKLIFYGGKKSHPEKMYGLLSPLKFLGGLRCPRMCFYDAVWT